MFKDIDKEMQEVLNLLKNKAPDAPVYCVYWTDGPGGFNGFKTLKSADGDVVRVIYRKQEKDGEVVGLKAEVQAGKGAKNPTIDLLESILSAVQKAAEDAGVDLDKYDGKMDPEVLDVLLTGWQDIGAELIIDFVGTREKFNGGGMLYEFRVGRDGSTLGTGQMQEASAEFREAVDEVYKNIMSGLDPFAFDRIFERATAAAKEVDPVIYAFFWTAKGDPVEAAYGEIAKDSNNVVRVEFTGKDEKIESSRVAAGRPVRNAARAILSGVAEVAADDPPDEDGQGLLNVNEIKDFTDAYKEREIVSIMDVLGGRDFDESGDLYCFQIKRSGLFGLGRVDGEGVKGFKHDLGALYKETTARFTKSGGAAVRWTPTTVKPKKKGKKKNV